MADQPNILFLMTDQMMGRALEPDHPCMTPNLDRLARRGVRFTHAYTPNPVCSPARASLMTGRLPHSHGVLQVTHTADEDRNVLRTHLPHFAQRLTDAGYHTGYFGKWHVEHTGCPGDFGWHVTQGPSKGRDKAKDHSPTVVLEHELEEPGYRRMPLYKVLDRPSDASKVASVTADAEWFLDQALAEGKRSQPWCCFASCIEPHDPFVCGKDAFERYDVDSIPVPENWHDPCRDKPGLYRRAGRAFGHLTQRQKQEAAACYYAMITEIDEQYGKLLDKLEAAGQLDKTIVVFTSDHGEMLGAHGLYMKNIGAFEEAYEIPMVVAGPGVAAADADTNGAVSARVGLHDLCPTLADLAGAKPIDPNGESHSLVRLLKDPKGQSGAWQRGYAEYSGGRIDLTQRVLWIDQWKLVYNAFDEDELYDHANDPREMTNLAWHADYQRTYEWMVVQLWQRIHQFGDHALGNMHYPVLRLTRLGPDATQADICR